MSNIYPVAGAVTTDYTASTEHSEAQPANTGASTGADFTAIIAEAMRDGMIHSAATAGTGGFSGLAGMPGAMPGLPGMPGGMPGLPGMPGGFMPMHDQGIEQAIINAASSGQMDDAQVALFMLMMMMQTSQGGDFSALMQMMATMIMQMQGERNELRNTAMASDFHPFVLDSIDRHVFNWNTPQTSGIGQVILPVEHWRPTTPAITSNVHNRSPELYLAVVNQFRVETSERYRPFRDGFTYCNIYVWDVTRAMGAELPLYTDPATGEPRFHPDIRGARSMGAIAMCNWLSTHGERFGWREVDAETAQMHANQGRPAVTSAGSIGHVQMVIPSRDRGFDPARGVAIAQAGRLVTSYTYITRTYGNTALNNNIRYWVHD